MRNAINDLGWLAKGPFTAAIFLQFRSNFFPFERTM
jgi:hypothetical protein